MSGNHIFVHDPHNLAAHQCRILAFWYERRFTLIVASAACKKGRAVTTTSNVRGQDELYERAASEYGTALVRLARGYEADPDKRRDLLQGIHLALWRSLEGFDALCSLRTWVYRVAHNAATSYVIRQRRARPQMLVSLEEAQALTIPPDASRKVALDQVMDLIQRLKQLDRQVILAWLDGMEAGEIAELTGLSPGTWRQKFIALRVFWPAIFKEAAMDDLKNPWQNQEVEEVRISVDELRLKAAKFQSRIRWRNLREQAACLFVIAFFAAMSLDDTSNRSAHLVRVDDRGSHIYRLAHPQMGVAESFAGESGTSELRGILSQRTRTAMRVGAKHLEVVSRAADPWDESPRGLWDLGRPFRPAVVTNCLCCTGCRMFLASRLAKSKRCTTA